MTRVPQFAVAGIVVAAVVGWYQARMPDDACIVANTTAELDSHRLLAAEASREIRREESDHPFFQPIVGVADMPVARERQKIEDPVSREIDLSTGLATGWPAPESHPTGSGGAGNLSANDKIDSATGIVVSGEFADSKTAVAIASAAQAGVEIDAATGAPVAR